MGKGNNPNAVEWAYKGHPWERVLEAVDDFWNTHRYSPNLTEIAKLSGYSKGHTHKLLTDMQEAGRIRYVTTGKQTRVIERC